MPQGLNDLLTIANTLDTLLGIPIAIYVVYRMVGWSRDIWKS